MSTSEDTPSSAEHRPEGSDYVSDRDFVDFPLSRELIQGIHEHGYRTATPIQAATIEPALAGRDLLARAKTGTGKTAAFAIPTIELVTPGQDHPQALILAPTRELAQQIDAEIQALTKYKKVRSAVLVGGLAMGPQEKALREGVEIIVGTPGRVLDHERRGNLDLSRVRIACLDEADEMVSMGFYEDVTKLLSHTAKDRQVLLFSATISRETARLVRQFLKEPENIILSTDADGVEGITHYAYEAPSGMHKARALLYVIDVEDPDAAIIFCNTREDTNTIASFLDRQGLDVQLISGELPQSRRSAVMKRVKAGEVRFLVATDVAARGIDIEDLTHVFNYSLPQDPTVYMHRIGRTGRIGREGRAVSLLSGTDMSTRRSLENVHKVVFTEIPFPDENTATKKRVDRQARQIRGAMGSMVFESYLPTARALLERDDGEILIATALKAFFTWDRQRKAAMVDIAPDDSSPSTDEPARSRSRTAKEPKGRSKSKRSDSKKSSAKSRSGRDRGRDRDPKPQTIAGESFEDLLEVDAGSSKPKEAKKPKKAKKAKKAKTDDSMDLDALLTME
ncbi:MAG: DEAD/DEAH box helicase [Deltaproteobacteria bacterium]|nr:MAG: DEAD/DEAH box helicase [Deltaproteobacteria bacterium]